MFVITKKEILITELKDSSRWDLLEQVRDLVPRLREFDVFELYNLFFNVRNNLTVFLEFKNPKVLRKQFKNRAVDLSIVKKYSKTIKDGKEFDPVFVVGDEFIDGGHRVAAYCDAGKDLIPVIDLQPLLLVDWKKWLNGDDL